MRQFNWLVPLLAALGWVAEPCHAQSLDERIRDIYAQLDKSAVQSGILIHQTPLFIWPGRYDGVNVADSMELSVDQFGILYGQFRGAAVGQSVLPDPGIYLSRALQRHKPGDTIGLALLAMRYDYIRADAQDANLLQWSNGKVLDVPGRPQSPYARQLCFASVALQQTLQGLTTHFSLPTELLFNNLGWNIDGVEVDFDDGQGWRVLPAGGVTTVTYSEAGRKRILVQYHRDGNTYQAATFVEVQGSLLERFVAPENGVPYDRNNPEVVSLGGLTLSIYSACEDKKVRRPLIVVEGFGGFHTPEKMFALLNAVNSSDEKLEDWLNIREYDLIWVDYVQPFAPIQTNANFLIGAIEWINTRKHADGSSEPNVLIGASMGGLVSKVALLKMHNQQNKDSEVDKFFSYDSPLKGANYPIGIQTFIRDLIYNAANIGASTASFQGALDLLDSPAARDMLATRVTQGPPACNGCPITFSAGASAEFTALQTTIAQWEAIRPISAIARHIVLSNGANMGILQENIATPTMQILKLHIELEEIAGAGVWQGCYDVIIDAKAYAATNQSTLVYERSITVDISLLCDPFANNSTQAVSFVLPAPLSLDNAPGGTTSLGLQQLEDGMAALIEALDHVEDSEHDVMINSFSFIHTISSLDMPAGTNPNTAFPNGGASVSRWTASNDNSEISPFSGLPEFNQEHVSINTRIVDVIVDELEPNAVPSLGGTLQSGEIYNFGRSTPINVAGPTETPRVIAQNLTIQAGAELWLNRNDRIGFVNALNPFNNKPQQFVVSVPGAACESDDFVTVATETGGKIILGEYDNGVANIGQLRFGKNSELIVEGAVFAVQPEFNANVTLVRTKFNKNFISLYSDDAFTSYIQNNTFTGGGLPPLGVTSIASVIAETGTYSQTGAFAGIYISGITFNNSFTNTFNNLANGYYLLNTTSLIAQNKFGNTNINTAYLPGHTGHGIYFRHHVGSGDLTANRNYFGTLETAIRAISQAPGTRVTIGGGTSSQSNNTGNVRYGFMLEQRVGGRFNLATILNNNNVPPDPWGNSYAVDCRIVGVGFRCDPGASLVSNVDIFNNNIGIKVPGGDGILLEGPNAGTGNVKVRNNDISLHHTGGRCGIHLLNFRGAEVKESNVVRIKYFQDVYGIWLEASANNTIDANKVYGVSSLSLLGRGIQLDNSPNNITSNNVIYDTGSAMRFNGDCSSENQIRCNHFYNSQYGMLYTSMARTGNQINTGNQWESAGYNPGGNLIGAKHESSLQSFVQFSTYRTLQGVSIQYPRTFELMPGITPGDWFVPGIEATCDPIPPGIISDGETQAAGTGIATGNLYEAGYNWLSRRLLYRKLKENPVLTSANNTIENFYQNAPNTTVGSYDHVDEQLLSAAPLPAAVEQQLQTLQNDADNAAAEMTTIEDAIWNSNPTPAELQALLDAYAVAANDYEQANIQMKNALQPWRGSLNLEIGGAAAENAALANTQTWENREKTINDLVLTKILTKQWLTGAERNYILETAQMCPWEGGLGVYKARAIWNRISGETFVASDCNATYRENTNQSSAMSGLLLYPNPAQQQTLLTLSPETVLDGAEYRLCSALGIVVQQGVIDPGATTTVLPLNGLSNGLYVCQVLRKGQVIGVAKFTVLNP